MKKITTLLILTLLSMSSVFASGPEAKENSNNGMTKLESRLQYSLLGYGFKTLEYSRRWWIARYHELMESENDCDSGDCSDAVYASNRDESKAMQKSDENLRRRSTSPSTARANSSTEL